MTMLAEAVDAVIGIDTHRDTHEVEIADAAGKPIAAMQVSNDSAGFAPLLAAIAKVAPALRVAVCIEGSRSYGIGLARALAAAGLLVIECEQPSRKQRRGKGKSDPIDAHLAVLAGDDTDRQAARRTLSKTALAALAGRELPAQANREQAVRQAEITRLALALRQTRCQLKDNHAQLLAIVEDIAPGLTSRYCVEPVSAAQAIVSFSHPGRCRSG